MNGANFFRACPSDPYKESRWDRIKIWKWEIEKRLIDPWYYPVRNFFFPHNVQKIRNCPRSFNDRSMRIVHCVFSMLCDFVEREYRGRQGLVEYIKMCDGGGGEYTETMEEVLTIYDWYQSVDWTNPEGIDWANDEFETIRAKEESWAVKEREMLVRAIDSRGGWWT